MSNKTLLIVIASILLLTPAFNKPVQAAKDVDKSSLRAIASSCLLNMKLTGEEIGSEVGKMGFKSLNKDLNILFKAEEELK